METVQEVLRNVDEKKLIDYYLSIYPISINDFDENITIGNAKNYTTYRLHRYIDDLKAIQIKSDNNKGIFFISRKEDGTGDNTVTNLVFTSDLKKYGTQAESYAFEFSSQNEIMGWWIADNGLTQTYLLDLLVEIMEEASFFGYKQEGLEKEVSKLAISIKEIDKNPGKSISFDDFKKKFDFDKQSPEEEKLETKIIQAQIEYSEYSRKKELEEILEKLDLK